MSESEIKSMIKDIIDNGTEYECKPNFECDVDGYCDWRLYKLGDEIHSDYNYRKVKKWYVSLVDGYYNRFTIIEDKSSLDIVFEGTKENCEKWIKEHTKTWLENHFKKCGTHPDRIPDITSYIKDVCRKILEEVSKKHGNSFFDRCISKDDLKEIITDLGVEL